MVKDECWQEWDDGFGEGWCLGYESGVAVGIRQGFDLAHNRAKGRVAAELTEDRKQQDDAYARHLAHATAHRDLLRQAATREPETDPK